MKDKVMESDDKPTVQGANGPLLGDMGGSKDHPSVDTMDQPKPSTAMVGCLEASGRAAKDTRKQKQRTEWVLGKAAQGLGGRNKGQAK